MYSAITAPKRSILTWKVAGTHQKIDQAARKALTPLLKRGETFPTTKEILYFEGRRGPDGLKLKKAGEDEVEHFIRPDGENPQLIRDMMDRYHNLVVALKQKNTTRAAFEAAWLAHLIADGLTPAHHAPYHEAVEEMMGEKEFLEIFGRPIKGIMRGSTAREAAKNNWKYWGVNGVMSRHVAFEYGVAVIASCVPERRYTPKIDRKEAKDFDLEREFRKMLMAIDSLDLYGAFGRDRWSSKMTSKVKGILLPSVVRLVTLAWYAAVLEAKK